MTIAVAVPQAQTEEENGIGPPPSCIVASFQPDAANHLLVLESGGFTYLSVSKSVDEGKLCFLDHRMESWDSVSDMCCLRKAGHVHAHVHHGDVTEDILLEQCMEEAGCTLPMPCDMGGIRTPTLSGDDHESDHEHQEGCGHNQIAHGDHFDWLIPMKDGSGSYVLKHAQATANGVSQFIEHGRLVKVGESLGQLKRRQKKPIIDLFTYEGPNRKGYEIASTTEETRDTDTVTIVKSPVSDCMALPSPQKAAVGQEDMVKVTIPRGFKGQGMTKTTLDVMGICCPSEVPLVKKILEPLPGVEEVLVNPTTKKVTVLHDATITADVQLVKILNQARLDASIQQRGIRRTPQKWPSPWTIGAGILLAISFGHYAWSPLRWVALGSVAVGIPPIVIRSLVALSRWVLDFNVLMLIAVAGAIALGDYVEAGLICFLFTLADWLESRSSDKARDAISNVADLAPQTAVLMDGLRVNVEDVSIGTLLAVKAGELIPIDGEVLSGKSSVDESNVTGESKPVEKTMGAVVWAGTMNLSGYISVKTTALAEDSAVSRMVRLVEEAQNQHSRTEHLVEIVAKYYTPLVVVTAILIAVIPLAAGSHRDRHWIYLALVLLVVACPCALVISTPVSTTCGIAQAARSGLLVRGGSHLEALAKVKVLAMDKTGTLTEGHFRVLDVHSTDRTSSVRQILYWIACVESKSSHPLAPALVAYARLHGVEPTGDISDFEIIPGLGVSAIVDGYRVEIGNARLAANFTGFEGSNSEIVETWSSLGATIGWVGVNERPVGVFGLADSVRPEAIEAVASLKKLGLRIVMLTGDSAAAASIVHTQIGDIEVHSELLPEDKVRLVKELKAVGVTAMVGDGINDAPALALADIGLAMGVAGSAVAMETADVALMTNDLRKIAVAIKLGRNVRMKILQNVSLSFLTKITIIALAAAGHPSLWAAVLADVGTCLVVLFNSMRLLHRKKGIVLPKFESTKHQGHHHDHDSHIRGHHHHKHVNHNHDHSHNHVHHEELGKIRDSHHHHNHEELGDCGDSHHHDHETLGQTGDDHLEELGRTCDHDHDHGVHKHDHHSHGGKFPCWPSHRRGHHDHKHVNHNHDQSHNHEELGKIRDNHHHHNHEELGDCGDSHHHDHETLGKTGDNHLDELGRTCDHDHDHGVHKHDHHSHGGKFPCWPSHRHEHCKVETKVVKATSDQTLSEFNCVNSWSKLQQKVTSITVRKSRKSCTKDNFDSNCCPDTKVSAGDKCCQSSSKDIKGRSKIKPVSRFAPESTSTSNCCARQVLGNECSSAHGSCSSGIDQESKPCSKLDLNPRTSQGTAVARQSCSGQDRSKYLSNAGKKLTVTCSKQCCSGKEEKECSDMTCKSASGIECCSAQDEGKKHHPISDVKPEVGLGNQCCSGEDKEKKSCSHLDRSLRAALASQSSSGEEKEKKPCSNSDRSLQAAFGNPFCSGHNVEKKCCSSSDKNVKAASDSQCCSGQYTQKKGCPSTNKKSQGVSGSQCCSGLDVEKKCINHSLTNPHGKVAGTEALFSCGTFNCKSADHSKCATEALLHSPLRDFGSFNRPVSPIN